MHKCKIYRIIIWHDLRNKQNPKLHYLISRTETHYHKQKINPTIHDVRAIFYKFKNCYDKMRRYVFRLNTRNIHSRISGIITKGRVKRWLKLKQKYSLKQVR